MICFDSNCVKGCYQLSYLVNHWHVTGLQRLATSCNCCVNNIAGDNTQNTSPEPSGALIRYHLVNIPGISQALFPFLSVSRMGGMECFGNPSIGFKVNGISFRYAHTIGL